MWAKIQCWLGWHDWAEFHGYHQERPKGGTYCLRPDCEARYHG